MSFKATSLVFMLAAFAVLAPVRSAPTFQARQDNTMSASSSVATPAATAAPADTSNFVKQNGLDAQKLNAQFATAKPDDSCQGAFILLLTNSTIISVIFTIYSWSNGLCHFPVCAVR
jgi:hypothetical protein